MELEGGGVLIIQRANSKGFLLHDFGWVSCLGCKIITGRQIMASTKYHQKSLSTMHSEDLENRRINRKIKKLKAEMTEISEQQEDIKQGQKEMRERFEEIDSECEQLKKETEVISDASNNVQLRLNIMFDILKARQEDDFAKVSHLTCSLRLL